MGYNSIENYYKMIFGMVQHHKWNLEHIEMLMPWEREIYVSMLVQHVKEENEKAKKEESEMKSKTSSVRTPSKPSMPHMPSMPSIPRR